MDQNDRDLFIATAIITSPLAFVGGSVSLAYSATSIGFKFATTGKVSPLVALEALPVIGRGLGKAGRAISARVGNLSPVARGSNGCFVVGTLIHTQNGLKAIEDIRIGEMVWARPEDGTGEAGYRRVNDTFTFEPKLIFEVTARAADGREETCRATGNHPFWIENSSEETGWTAAEDLQTGGTLRLADGSPATVVSLTDTGALEPVYNFEVDGWHTYHIGKLGTWVHNTNCRVGLLPQKWPIV